jgi:proline dehydrogenase
MALMRSMLLAASQNAWLREHAVHYPFVKRSVSRFMPGETVDAALAAAQTLAKKNIGTVFTYLGENVADRGEARKVAEHYVQVIKRIYLLEISAEVSVKLTQLGLDLSPEFCAENLDKIIAAEKSTSTVWIDMEASNYVDATLGLYKQALRKYPNVGICLQAYLYRTRRDIEDLLPIRPSIRLVKGAYNEPANVAYPKKTEVNESYLSLAQQMLRAKASGQCARAAFGTHDIGLIGRISDYCAQQGFANNDIEIQMLYGIQRAEQERLARDGCRSVVLVAYGDYWYPWFVRRLAERPANLWFMLRNVFAS